MFYNTTAPAFYLPGMNSKTKKASIRPELIGAKITTKAHPTPIEIVDSKECRELCAKLGLDIFTADDSKAENTTTDK